MGDNCISRQIKELRIARGLTQKQLARKTGTKQPRIAQIEDPRYRNHSLRILRRVCKALRADLIVKLQ